MRSDSLTRTRFQLIYTLGVQRNMDGQPDRWLLIQSIFDLIGHHACLLEKSNQMELEVEKQTAAGYPAVRLLSEGISEKLICNIASSICENGLPLLPLTKRICLLW